MDKYARSHVHRLLLIAACLLNFCNTLDFVVRPLDSAMITLDWKINTN